MIHLDVSTPAEAIQTLRAGTRPVRHKYRAKPTVLDGIRFDSAKEAAFYQELKWRESIGEVRRIQVHEPVFPLNVINLVTGEVTTVGNWRPDFKFQKRCGAEWEEMIVDVKGFATQAYRRTKKIVEAQYGIRIIEV